jgi:hypothetical protein
MGEVTEALMGEGVSRSTVSRATKALAHLAPGNFTEHERKLVDVQLHDAPVLPLPLKRQA